MGPNGVYQERERLIEGDIARKFMAAVLNQEPVKVLLSDDHFSVDGTLIEAWAVMKSFCRKDGGGAPPAAGRNHPRAAPVDNPDARMREKPKSNCTWTSRPQRRSGRDVAGLCRHRHRTATE